MSLREKVKLKVYGQRWWGDQVSLNEANELHEQNVSLLQSMAKKLDNPNRPVHIVGVIGSSRNRENCAHETSNSALLLRRALKGIPEDNVSVKLFDLSTMNIEPCNGCYSGASSLCRLPCDCYPIDDMQEVYAHMLLADGVLISTGVHEFMPSSRVKLFVDRLISLDGGRFAPKYNVDGKTWKNAESKNAEQNVSLAGDFQYVQRMAGKSLGVLTTCKDFGSYKVAMDLVGAFNAYGFVIPPNAVAVWNAPRVAKDTAFDKHDLLNALASSFGEECADVARGVVRMARLMRKQTHQNSFAKKMTGRA